MPLLSSEIEIDMEPRPGLSHRWSGEDETWDSMLRYIHVKCNEERQMEDIKAAATEVGHITTGTTTLGETLTSTTDEDTIQRRMSIHNFL